MSYYFRLCITHIATAMVAAHIVWFGLNQDGVGHLAFVVLLSGSIAVPTALAAWWFRRGLRLMEHGLTQAGSDAPETGDLEFDSAARRVQTTLEHQRMLARDVDLMLQRMGRSAGPADGTAMSPGRMPFSSVLGEIVRSTMKDVGRILSFRDDIAQGAHEIHRGGHDQARLVASVIGSIEGLSGKTDAVLQNAESAGKATLQMSDSASRGLGFVQDLRRGMERIRTNVESSEKRVQALGERSQQIGSIVETMGNISARTDMLALNASIEAVRAGQEGRGFAIVADEVRKLAETTATASRQIAGLVEAIQNETHNTIATMTDERQQVQEEVSRVIEVGRTLDEISRCATDSTDQVRQISRSAMDHLRGTQEVIQAVQQVCDLADRIRDSGESIRHKTSDLVVAVQDLEEGLSPFYHCGDVTNSVRGGRSASSRAVPVVRSDRIAQSPGDELLAAVARKEFSS